jgi:acyl-CoA thioester hydrolase
MDAEKTVEALLEGYPVVIAIPVQWGDQDAFGHVNNTVYFRWFESARIAYFQRMGLLAMLPAERIGPILASSSCEYRRSITFPDTVHVGIRVTRIGRTSIGFEHRIISAGQGLLAAEGISTTVVINYADDNRPHPVAEAIRKAVEEIEGNQFGS